MRKIIILSIILYFVLAVVACKKDAEEIQEVSNTIKLDSTPYTIDYGMFPIPLIAIDNPLTVQGVLLGRMLFHEKMLSGNNTMSCSSCHKQEFAFSDTAKFSVGIDGLIGKRNSMSAVNMAWNTNGFFWDGRAELLRHQSLLPIQDVLEMNETLENVVAKLNNNQQYKDQFVRSFGSPEITNEKISFALEQFMNSIVSNQSKYDKYLAGTVLLDSSEERGRELFFAEFNPFFPEISGADCAHCHSGDNFSNNQYMNNGTKTDIEMIDLGRFDVTQNIGDKGKFKVPTLRNIELTAPYMSDGKFANLEEVINHYNGGLKISSTLDPALEQTMSTGLLLSSQDKADLVAFLKTLTDNALKTDNKYSNPF
jgi:cytochrome c peroxidase